MTRHPVLFLIAAMAAALGPTQSAPATQLYASATGRGTACTAAHPCALTTARAKVRSLVPSQRRDIVVNLAAGTYRLTSTFELGPQDSGGNGHKVTWQAVPGGTVTFSAAQRVTGFSRYDVRNDIWRAPVPASAPDSRQLYVDGVRAVLARTSQTWPAGNGIRTPTRQGLARPRDSWL